MSDATLVPLSDQPDLTGFACASFLAGYRGGTLRAYGQDLAAFLRWCAERELVSLQAQRPHLELYIRWMEQRGYAPSTIGRRFTTVAGFFKYAVIDGHLVADPTLAVTRPRVPWEAQRRTAAARPAVRAEACRQPHHAALRPGSREPGPTRRPCPCCLPRP